MGKVRPDRSYYQWIALNEPSDDELKAQRGATFALAPKISVVTPAYNTREQFLVAMVESLLAQTYPNWELCVADGGSTGGVVRTVLERYAARDERIRPSFLDENRGIAGNTNAALSMASGEFVAFLDHDDILPPFGLYEVVAALNREPDLDFIYSDQDMVTEDGKVRTSPFFKPDWAPDNLRSQNYISHLAVIRRRLLEEAGGIRLGFDGSQDYDLFLRISEMTDRIHHIPKILYHWRAHPESAAGSPDAKNYAFEAGARALGEHIERVGLKGTVRYLQPFFYDIVYNLAHRPLVSIIIPSHDNIALLRNCVDSIISKSSYDYYEVLILENNSVEPETFAYYEEISKREKVRVLTYNEPFNFSVINNYAARHAAGEVLLFLNNDTEVISEDWLERMVGFAIRKEVGAVGAMLYYPDDLIQHAGIIIGMLGLAAHSHLCYPRGSSGYFSRLTYAQDVSAVTGACLMMRKEVFDEVGGFDAKFQLAFGDVDLCMKVREKGWLIVFTPHAELYHHESRTRGYDTTPDKFKRFQCEFDLFISKWKETVDIGDPYYNPNLTLDSTAFYLRLPKQKAVIKDFVTRLLADKPRAYRFVLKVWRRYFRPLRDFVRNRFDR